MSTFQNAKKLKYIQLQKNKNSIKQSTCQALLELFDSLPEVQTLHLEQCQVSEQVVCGLFEGLLQSSSVKKLKQLGLIDLDISLEYSPTQKKQRGNNGAKGKAKEPEVPAHPFQVYLAHKSCKLQTLFLNGNNLGLKGAMLLAQGLCFNKNIRILDLSRNSLGPKGVQLIVEALGGSLMLKSLDLSYNNIGNSGAHSLSQMLPKGNLLELRIQGNAVAQEGMISLFGALSLAEKAKKKSELKNLSKLKIIDLSMNKLQIGILHSFRQFLEQNKEVCALSISGFERINERAFGSIC